MTIPAQRNIQTAAALAGLALGAISLVSVAYAALQYPYRLEQLENVVIPEIRSVQKELKRDISLDRARALETRELLLRIDERLQALQRALDAQ